MSSDFSDVATASSLVTESEDGGQAYRQFVLFLVGTEQYAAAVDAVQEIIRVPQVVRVPLAPAALEGLANLRGQILPILSLRRVFQLPERAYDDAARAVVVGVGQPVGCTVDRVISVVTVPVEAIEPTTALEESVQADWLCGVIKDANDLGVAMVLDVPKILAQAFGTDADRQIDGDSRPVHGSANEDDDGAIPDEATEELQLVSFEVARQEYAIPVADVQEIVQMPDRVMQIPHSPPSLLGVMTLRQQLLPLVSLRRLFGLPDPTPDTPGRVVVLTTRDGGIGMVTDNVREVLRVPKTHVESLPAILRDTEGWHDVEAVCRLEHGQRLVSILSAEQLFRQSSIREALSEMESWETSPDAQRMDLAASEPGDDEVQVVVFRLEQAEFGVPIDAVQEIVRIPERLTQIPQAPSFVEGVINLRGTVLPVVDLRRRLGLPPVARSDRQRIMVFCLEEQRTGFIVDAVSEVLKIPAAALQPVPRMTQDQVHILNRVANLEAAGRIIQLLDPSPLITSHGLREWMQTVELNASAGPEGSDA